MTINQTNNQWTKELVAQRFESAITTIRRLPAIRVSGYVSTWPEIFYDKHEIAMMDHKPKRWPATARQITEMEETCKWINFLDKVDDRKIVWYRASRLPWKEICVRLGIARSTANLKWQNAILTITNKLNRFPMFTNH